MYSKSALSFWELPATNNNRSSSTVTYAKGGLSIYIVYVVALSISIMINYTTLVQGNIRADNLEELLAGKHIPDLIKMIKDNDAYVNVHTAQNPKGEIRGQILSVSSSSATAASQ